MIYQTRIFAPFNAEYGDNWAENILGRIVRPGIRTYRKPKWFWFSRYTGGLQPGDERENCVVDEVKAWYDSMGVVNDTRSLRFRFEISASGFKSFINQLERLIKDNGCFITDFREFKFITDLGSDRHIGGNRSQYRRTNRAKILTAFYYSTSLLILDNLVEQPPKSRNFIMEHNDAVDINGTTSSFTVPHHLFCNMTDLPTNVFLNMVNNQQWLQITTGSFSPLVPGQQQNWQGIRLFSNPIRIGGNTFPTEQDFTVRVKF